MSTPERLEFTGNLEKRPKEPHRDSPSTPEPYIVDPELQKAVNLAIYLRRPLLLEGDPGCGKTRLASAVAYELGLPLYRWDVRSTTKAQDGLYEYDAILRLHDVQIQKIPSVDKIEIEEDGEIVNRNPANPKHYRRFGPLGKAFRLQDCPGIVLIDEIDKADLDFPNDLLTVLDAPWEFKIKETGELIKATTTPIDCRPIVFITSNKEKGNLPIAFLRRCLYYYVEFPNDLEKLQEIVEKHYEIAEISPPPNNLVVTAINRFLNIWNEGGLFKRPGTSEFLDWLKALHTFEPNPYDAEQLIAEQLLPYRELLFKIQADWKKYAKVL